MSKANFNYNTKLVVFLLLGVFAITLIRLIFYRIVNVDVRFDNSFYGLLVIGFFLLYYQRNNLWILIPKSKVVIIYCLYITLSSIYGYIRYRTFIISVFDIWFFAFIPAVLLIPAFSFSVRAFDNAIAAFVIMGYLGIIFVIIISPQALYDRDEFAKYSVLLSHIAAGYIYLLLKNAGAISIHTAIGMFGAVTNALLYGVVGAFRGQLILSIIAIGLFFILQITSRNLKMGVKIFSFLLCLSVVFLTAVIATARFGEQLAFVGERFIGIADRYSLRGEVATADGRLNEAQYFLMLNPARKLFFGHGVGAVWWDFYSMYDDGASVGDDAGKGVAGVRSMLHINWLHLAFKIGVVGILLIISMVIAVNRGRGFFKRNPAWWAFLAYYLAWTSYYGDKELTARAVVLITVLVHPWLFKTFGNSRGPVPKFSRR